MFLMDGAAGVKAKPQRSRSLLLLVSYAWLALSTDRVWARKIG